MTVAEQLTREEIAEARHKADALDLQNACDFTSRMLRLFVDLKASGITEVTVNDTCWKSFVGALDRQQRFYHGDEKSFRFWGITVSKEPS